MEEAIGVPEKNAKEKKPVSQMSEEEIYEELSGLKHPDNTARITELEAALGEYSGAGSTS